MGSSANGVKCGIVKWVGKKNTWDVVWSFKEKEWRVWEESLLWVKLRIVGGGGRPVVRWMNKVKEYMHEGGAK